MKIVVDKRPKDQLDCFIRNMLRERIGGSWTKLGNQRIKMVDILCSGNCKKCNYITTIKELKSEAVK